ncbi:hypothetical protein C8J57DRAFT_1254657 [Mycena rebaudengoi]|nr:hypothetical protein C8J57DRAFT_1254657 [Mycena rebaudengoi]
MDIHPFLLGSHISSIAARGPAHKVRSSSSTDTELGAHPVTSDHLPALYGTCGVVEKVVLDPREPAEGYPLKTSRANDGTVDEALALGGMLANFVATPRPSFTEYTFSFFSDPVRGRLLDTYPSTPPNCPRKSSAAATQSVLHVLLLPRPLEQRNITFAGHPDTQEGGDWWKRGWARKGSRFYGSCATGGRPVPSRVLDEKVRGTLHNTGVPANLSLKLDFNRIQPNLRLTEEHDKDKDTRIPSSREYQDKLLYIGQAQKQNSHRLIVYPFIWVAPLEAIYAGQQFCLGLTVGAYAGWPLFLARAPSSICILNFHAAYTLSAPSQSLGSWFPAGYSILGLVSDAELQSGK